MTRRFRFSRIFLTGASAALFAACLSGPVLAQDMQNLMNRLTRMERDMQDLQRQLYRGTGTGITATPVTPAPITSGSAASGSEAVEGSYAARLEVRLQQLEAVIRSLTGKIEEVEFKVEQNSNRIDRLVRDVDFRLQALEKGGVPAPAAETADQLSSSAAPAASSSTDQTPSAGQGQGVLGYLKESEVQSLGDGSANAAAGASAGQASGDSASGSAGGTGASAPTVLADGTPEEQYKEAFSYLQKQDFDKAEQALSLFLEKHPQSPLAGNAIYWLGETYYVRKDFARAAKTFATGYTDYPASSKTADNLLKLGFSLARMDRKDDACVTFDQLKADFPNASSNIKRRAEVERNRIACP